jgi:hypothetical protein
LEPLSERVEAGRQQAKEGYKEEGHGEAKLGTYNG